MTDSQRRRRPSWVFDHGAEPDPRFTLANERTFLAWIRTSLGLLAGAAAVHILELDLKDWVASLASTLLALTALLCALQAWVNWARTERAMREGRPLPSSGSGVALVAVVGVAAVVLVVAGL